MARSQSVEMKTCNFLIIALFGLLGCTSPTKEEREVLFNLNSKYNEYQFSTDENYLGTNLKVTLTKNEWDSLSLKNMYDSTIGSYKGSKGIPWVYLSVYDISGTYLFTISKDNLNEKHNFFKE